MIYYSNKILNSSSVKDIINKIKLEESILLYPTNRKVKAKKNEILKNSSTKSFGILNIFTLESFFEKLFRYDLPDYNKLTPSIEFVFLREILDKVKLRYFSQKRRHIPKSLIVLFSNIITRYKELGLYEEEILKTSENLERKTNISKNKDIYEVFNYFQKRLKDFRLYQVGDIYKYLLEIDAKKFQDLLSKTFPNVNNIILEGFSEFTTPEIKLIERLSSIENINLILKIDFNFNNDELFSNQIKLNEKLIKIFPFYLDVSEENSDSVINQLKDNLFLNNSGTKINTDKKFSYVEANDIQEEVELIAKIIKNKIHNEKKYRINDIAILINNIEDYSDILRDVFNRFQIPINLTDRFWLEKSASIIIIIKLLKLINSDFLFSDLIDLIKSYYFENNFTDRKAIIEYILSSGIISGKNNFLEDLKQKIEFYNETIKTEGEEDYKLKKSEEYKLILEELNKFFSKFNIDKKTRLKPVEFVKSIKKLLSDLGVYEYIFNFNISNLDFENKIKLKSKEIGALAHFNNILNELIEISKALNSENIDKPLDYYIEFIENAILGVRYNINPNFSKGILVTTPNEIRGLQYPLVFLCSMNNGNFPKKYKSLFYLEKNYQEEQRENLFSERYLFFETLKSFSEEIIFTYKKYDNQKGLYQSDFITEISKIVELKPLEVKNINEIYNIYELYRYIENDNFRIIGEIESHIKDVKERKDKYKERKKGEAGSNLTGYIKDEEILKKIQKSIERREFSATQIRTYMNCPFKYFLNYIIAIKEAEEIEEEIQGYEYGTLFHLAVKEFFDTLNKNNLNIYKELQDNFDQVYEQLIKITKKLIEKEYEYNEYKFIFYHYFFEDPGLALLKNFLIYEREKEEKISPRLFEFAFKETLEIDNNQKIIIKGSVDRIDYEEDGKLVLQDYKTGKLNSKIKDIQVPLYLYIIREIFEREGKRFKELDCGWVKLEKNKQTFKIQFDSALKKLKILDLTQFIKDSLKDDFYNKFISGDFSLNKDNINVGICRSCEFKSICRKEYIEEL